MALLTRPHTTERLEIRRFAPTDLDALAQILADEGVNRYLYSEPRDRAGAIEALARRVGDGPETPERVVNAAVVLADSGQLIGDFMLHWREDEHRQGEIGGSLHPAHQGRGYAVEVYGVLLALAFSECGLHRVVGRCDARNTASIRSLEKAGLRREAHFRENEFVKGEWTDEVVLALLRDEWEQCGRTVREEVSDTPNGS